MKLKLSLLVASFALTLGSCGFKYIYYTENQQAKLDGLDLPESTESLDYEAQLPVHLTTQGLFARPIDGDKARLGRVIFYDKSLSADGKVSCASCHLQSNGFSDVTVLSKGVNDRESARNSIALSSVVNFSAYYGTDINGPGAIRFGWDNRAGTVTEQSRNAFTNPNEMGRDMTDIINEVKSKKYYEPLFQKAYNTDPKDDVTMPSIDEAKVFECLTHFINAMSSYNSPFDAAANKLYAGQSAFSFGQDKITNSDPMPGFNAEQNAGKALFMANCASCHTGNMGRPTLNYANNGLDEVYTDKGVGIYTSGLDYQFKVPTLRNIEISAPYMHDGRFATLEQVIDHYSTGVKNNAVLSPRLRGANGAAIKMNFTPDQKAQLVAFLKTFTDESVKQDERFSDPFQ